MQTKPDTDSEMETYAIIHATALNGLDFSEFRQDSADTCRRSVDGSMAIVSWFGSMPTGLEPISTYSADEMTDVISGAVWTPLTDDSQGP